MVIKVSQKDYTKSWVGVFFCLILFLGYLSSPQTCLAYHTLNTRATLTLRDLVEQSHGAVRQLNEYYIINDNVVIAEQDTLSIGSTDILVFDCSKNVVRLTVEGNLDAASGCSSIIADKPIRDVAELDPYQRYQGIIYDDLGVRRRAQPKIRSTSTSRTYKPILFASDTVSMIQGTITDASTGQPIPARISIRKSDRQYVCDTDCAGNPVNYISLPGYWITNGSFTSGVSAGTTDITVSQGYEYIPYHGTFDIASGEIRTLAISLTPIVSMNSAGWYAGDAHNHICHGEKTYRTDIPFAARIARGQGYDWFYAGRVWSTATSTIPASQLDDLCLQASTTNFLCLWNQEYPKDFMGHEITIGLKNYLSLHVNNSTTFNISYPHYELAQEVQKQGGFCIYTHPSREYDWITDSTLYPGEYFPQNLAREFPLDMLIVPEFNPLLDFMTDYVSDTSDVQFWYTLLNRGYRIGAAAFTDAVFDNLNCTIGHNMTYVYVPDTAKTPEGALTQSVLETALSAQLTFGTSGPLVLFSIDSHIPGETISVSTNTFHAQIQAYCVNRLGYDLKKIELIRNGYIIQSFNVQSTHLQSFSTTLNFTEATQAYYIVRVSGTDQRNYLGQMAYTSPIYFALGSSYQTPQPVYAQVTGNIFDLGIPDPIDAQIDILNFGEVIQSLTAANGAYNVTVPATSRIRVSYGKTTVTKSIFLDYKPLYDKIVRCRASDLNNPAIYDDLVSLLGSVRLDFQLPIAITEVRQHWSEYQ